MSQQKWFISHPSIGPQSTPAFFSAIERFSTQHEKDIDFILPHDEDNQIRLTKGDIESADLVIAEVSISSTGSGIELGWAHAAGKPVIVFHQVTSPISPGIQFVATAIHSYVDTEQITETLDTLL